jgi:hypothetical protein
MPENIQGTLPLSTYNAAQILSFAGNLCKSYSVTTSNVKDSSKLKITSALLPS